MSQALEQSASTSGAPQQGGGQPAAAHPSLTAMRPALRAEWIKLRTVASPAWLLAAAMILTIAVSAAALAANRCPAGTSCHVDTAKLSLTGILFGQAIVAILAVQPVCGEYGSGMIRVTLAAMPRRCTVLAAKTAVSTGLVLAVSAVAVLGCVLAGRLILPGNGFSRDLPLLSLGYGPTLRAVAGSVLYLGLIAVLSIGVAAIVRDPASTIGVVLGVLYVFPIIDVFIGNTTWHDRIERYSPMAGLNIQATVGLKSLAISPWMGLGVLATWSLAALAGGALSLRLRDA
jgi:ABC-2 type transport system permease protein